MKICYLLPGVGLGSAERQRREGILNAIAARGTSVVVDRVADGPRSIENAIDEYKAMPHVLDFIIRNQAQYDGFIIGCAGDSGLEGAREQSRKPVAGPGESSILLGAIGDRRFSMVTISQERARIKRRLVRAAGIDEHRLVSSHALDLHVLELAKDERKTQLALMATMREAKDRGAEVMLIGCMSVAFMRPALLGEAVAETGLKLINPIVAAVKLVEALVALEDYGRAEAVRAA